MFCSLDLGLRSLKYFYMTATILNCCIMKEKYKSTLIIFLKCIVFFIFSTEVLHQVRRVELRDPAVGDLLLWPRALPQNCKYSRAAVAEICQQVADLAAVGLLNAAGWFHGFESELSLPSSPQHSR